MSSELIISGVTFTNSIAKALPTISGLLTVGFFGTGNDGINTNRVSGGPTLQTLGNAPTYSSNYATLGSLNVTKATATATVSGGAVTGFTITNGGSNYALAPAVVIPVSGGGSGAAGTATISGGVVTGITVTNGGSGYTSAPTVNINGGNNSSLDTGITLSSVISGGYSYMIVARAPATGLPSALMSNQRLNPSTGLTDVLYVQNVHSSNASQPTLSFFQASSERITITLPTATSFRMYGLSYSGGATGTYNLYSLSDNLTGSYVTSGLTATAQTFQLGPTPFDANLVNTSDVPFALVASGVLSLPTMQNIYASVKSLLARRGITVV